MSKRVLIIGSGPAGLTSAIYTSRALLETVVISGKEPGGQLMGTTLVENFPGFSKGIMGPDLMLNMREQAENFGAKIIDSTVDEVDFKSEVKKVRIGDKWHEAEAVIIATGSSPRWLNVPGEKEFVGRGVSICATCDAYFFRGKKVAVVGGGDSALEEANFLTKFASEIVIIHRRSEFRASKIMQEKVLSNPKIKIIWNTVIDEMKGGDKLESLVLKDVASGEKKEMPFDGVFIAIGHDPATDIFKGQIDLDEAGYILANSKCETNIPGVFVAGDVADHLYRQAIHAAGMGCRAGLEAGKYLERSKN